MYKYIKNTPTIKLVNNFLLVHAELLEIQEENYNLWGRKNFKIKKRLDDYIIISGHTPLQKISPLLFEPKILNRNGLIYIDYGVYRKSDGKLACLRLNDMKEFYIERKTKLLN